MASQLEVIVSIKQIGSGELDKVRGALMKLGTQARELFNTQKLLTGAVVGGMAVKYVDAYEESRRATERLQQAMTNVGISYIENQKHVEEVTKALQRKTNYGDDEQVAALSELIPLVGSYSKAMNALPQILDLAAFMQTDLKDASAQYAQILNGEVPKGLGRVMPMLKDLQKNGASTAQIMEAISEKTRGMAEADVSPMIQMKNALGDVAENIGKELLPAVALLKDTFVEMPPVLQNITVALPALAGAMALLGGPVTAVAAAIGGLIIMYGKLREAQDGLQNAPSILKKEDFEQLGARAAKIQNDIQRYKDTLEKSTGKKDTSDFRLKELQQQYENVRAEMDKQAAGADARAETRIKIEQDRAKMESDRKIERLKALNAETERIENKARTDRLKEEDAITAMQKDIKEANRKKEEEDVQRYNDNLEGVNKRRLEREARALEKTREKINEQAAFMQSLGSAFASGIGQGSEGLKESLKAVLTTVVSFIEKQIIAGQIAAAVQSAISWNPLPLLKIAAITAAFEAAKGGISAFATGTPFAGGGMALVGERGPELVNLARGSQVYNNSQTRNMVTNNNPTVVVVNGSGNLARDVARATRNKSINWKRELATAGVY